MGPPRKTSCLSFVALVLLLLSCMIVRTSAQSTRRFNITKMLAGHPRFSVLNQMLTTRGLAKEINSRRSVTLLAPSNAVMKPFQTSHAATDAVKITDLLRYHVLLTYFDMAELRGLKSANYTQVTTLLQTTGRARGRDGFLNIYNVKSRNAVKVGPTVSNSSSNVTVLAGVQKSPFDISILEIDQVLLPVGFNNASGSDLISVLDSFQEFTLLITYLQETNLSSVLAEMQNSAKGMTVFVPKDSAFSSLSTGSIQALSLPEERLLLQYHVLTGYRSLDSLQTMVNNRTATLASSGPSSYMLNVSGDPSKGTVKLRTGISTATILEIVYDAKPVTMYAVDHVLLPPELFTLPPAPAPTPPPPPPKKSPAARTSPSATDSTDSSAPLAQTSSAVIMAALFACALLVLS